MADGGRVGPLSGSGVASASVASAVGWAFCPADVSAAWVGAGAAEAAEAVVVSDCQSRFASSIPAKVPAAATARTRVMIRAAISPVRDPEREAGRGSDGSTGAV